MLQSTTDIYVVAFLEIEKKIDWSKTERDPNPKKRHVIHYRYDVESDKWDRLMEEFYKSFVGRVKLCHDNIRNLFYNRSKS